MSDQDKELVKLKRKEVTELYGLPEDAQASDVIQHAVAESGHYCTLADLMKLAELFDGSVHLSGVNHEHASVGDPVVL